MRSINSSGKIIFSLVLSFHFLLALADPPVASSVSITTGPFVPTDIILGSYTYSDADGDPESGTLIQWYVNTSPTSVGASLVTSGTLSFFVTSGYRGNFIAMAVTPDNAVDGPGSRVFSNWELINARPQATDDNYINQSDEGETLSISAPGVLSNDNSGGDGQTIQAYEVTGPDHGILTLNTNGSFDYEHDGSESHTDDFTYRVYDGYEYSLSLIHI